MRARIDLRAALAISFLFESGLSFFAPLVKVKPTLRHRARQRDLRASMLIFGQLKEVFRKDVVEDADFMKMALEEARLAAEAGEVPIGAVIVHEGRVLARAGNRTIRDCDPTAHAEIVALREAARCLRNYRLAATTLYVTLEPCAMCAGAMVQARIARVVYGADDPKGGAVRTCFNVLSHAKLNHQVDITAGVLAEESAEALQKFFMARR